MDDYKLTCTCCSFHLELIENGILSIYQQLHRTKYAINNPITEEQITLIIWLFCWNQSEDSDWKQENLDVG